MLQAPWICSEDFNISRHVMCHVLARISNQPVFEQTWEPAFALLHVYSIISPLRMRHCLYTVSRQFRPHASGDTKVSNTKQKIWRMCFLCRYSVPGALNHASTKASQGRPKPVLEHLPQTLPGNFVTEVRAAASAVSLQWAQVLKLTDVGKELLPESTSFRRSILHGKPNSRSFAS